jgi:4-carboxymuconolactone decarboxylase
MFSDELRSKGREIWRQLSGPGFQARLDRDGYTDRHMQKLAEVNEGFIFGYLWTRPGLDLKSKILIALVSDAASGELAAFKIHVRFGLENGWTEDDISDAIIHMFGYIGGPRARGAMIAAREVFDEVRKERPS